MIKYAGKICLCAISAVIGTIAGGIFSSVLRLEQPRLPERIDPGLLVLLCLAGGFVLSIALAVLLPQLRGNRRTHFMVIAWFVFAWLGINNTIEASIFTTIGGGQTALVSMLFLSAFAAGAVVLLFGNQEITGSFSDTAHRYFDNRTAMQWAFRLSLTVLAFPAVYFFFGMPVGLLVGKFYQDQSFGLHMPSLGVVIGVQFVRSLLSLVAVLPILVIWRGSRRSLVWTCGLNLFVVAGLFGLIQAYWMPWTLRSIHTVELLLDSVVYGWLVAALLLPRVAVADPAPVEETGVANYTI